MMTYFILLIIAGAIFELGRGYEARCEVRRRDDAARQLRRQAPTQRNIRP